MTDSTVDKEHLAGVREKYARERDRRLRSDGLGQYIQTDEGEFYDFFEGDPYTPLIPREPRHDYVEVLIVGAGFSGIL